MINYLETADFSTLIGCKEENTVSQQKMELNIYYRASNNGAVSYCSNTVSVTTIIIVIIKVRATTAVIITV